MNEKLTQLRRELQREAELMGRPVLKGIRWLLLKHPDNLDASKNERQRLQEALALNQSLATAYYLKEDLTQLWQQPDRGAAEGSSQTGAAALEPPEFVCCKRWPIPWKAIARAF